MFSKFDQIVRLKHQVSSHYTTIKPFLCKTTFVRGAICYDACYNELTKSGEVYIVRKKGLLLVIVLLVSLLVLPLVSQAAPDDIPDILHEPDIPNILHEPDIPNILAEPDMPHLLHEPDIPNIL